MRGLRVGVGHFNDRIADFAIARGAVRGTWHGFDDPQHDAVRQR